jgi:hypothetical protein
MKITFELATVLTAFLIVPTTAAMADGVIHQLPPDGSWVRFDVAGAGLKSDGAVAVALKGTMTVKSVGVEQVDGGDCRWIEIETAIEFKRGDGPPANQTEILKLLIPAKHFATGQNPRAHVIRAWKKTGNGVAVELDLKGGNSREVESLDELFNGGLAKS